MKKSYLKNTVKKSCCDLLMDEQFWMQDPKILFKNFDVIPKTTMSNNEKLNAMTRLLVVITIALYFMDYDSYLTVFIIGIFMILFLKNKQPVENFTAEVSNRQALNQGIRGFVPGYDSRPHVPQNAACWFDQNTDLINAKYEITPNIQFNHDNAAKRSYSNAKYELLPQTKTPGFDQIWRAEPAMQGNYTMTPDPFTQLPVQQPDESLYHENYIVRSKIDHLGLDQSRTNLNSVRGMAEDGYLQSVMQQRNAIMNDHIDRFRRERQHNCADMKLNRAAAGAGGAW